MSDRQASLCQAMDPGEETYHRPRRVALWLTACLGLAV